MPAPRRGPHARRAGRRGPGEGAAQGTDALAPCVVVIATATLTRRGGRQADVEAAFQRITNHKGVKGILIVDDEGRELRTTLSAELTEKYSELIPQLASMARSAVRDLDPSVRRPTLAPHGPGARVAAVVRRSARRGARGGAGLRGARVGRRLSWTCVKVASGKRPSRRS